MCVCVHVCTCRGILCVHVHKLCEPTLFGFCNLQGLRGSFARVCARAPVCRISLCVCVFVTASVREHGEMLFTAFSVARLHDGSRHRGRRGGGWGCASKRWGVKGGKESEWVMGDSARVIQRLTGEPLSFMLIEGACTELYRQLTCPSRCSLWFSTSVKTGSHFVSPLFICLTTQNIMEHCGAQ